jgi:uncharacterized phiE125 gp8 family phage protein
MRQFRPDGRRPLPRLVSPPSGLIVDLATVKLHCKIQNDDHDAIISNVWIPTAIDHAQKLSNEVLLTQAWDITLSRFPEGRGEIELWPKPVQSIESIIYRDESGASQSFGSYDDGSPPSVLEYFLQRDPVRPFIGLNPGYSWPATADALNAVVVRASCGYGFTSDVPARFIHGVLLLCGHFYRYREETSALDLKQIPIGIKALLEGAKIG